MNISIRNFLPKNEKTKQDLMTIILIISTLIVFVMIYNSYFKKAPIISVVDDVKKTSVGVISSAEASRIIVDKVKKDIKRIQDELKNPFYSSLKKYEPASSEMVSPGRGNPFVNTF
ncbi:MAG: hypothetical protein AAB614_00045 [Patescibacteria group bacterium]